ncbi:hypothetical protein [Verminephrobacter eiseniae]
MSRHRSSVGPRWPSKRIAALHRLPIRSVWAARCALRCAPMAARSLRHLIGDATLGATPEPQKFPSSKLQPGQERIQVDDVAAALERAARRAANSCSAGRSPTTRACSQST